MIIDGHHHCNLDHSDHLVLPWLGEAPSQETPRSGFTREGIQESSLNNSAQSHSQYWESKTESTQYVSIETIANESRYWDICKTKERVQWLNSSQQSFQNTFYFEQNLISFTPITEKLFILFGWIWKGLSRVKRCVGVKHVKRYDHVFTL